MIYSYLVHNINLPNWNKLSDHTMNHFKRRIGTFSAASIVKQNQLKFAKPGSSKTLMPTYRGRYFSGTYSYVLPKVKERGKVHF